MRRLLPLALLLGACAGPPPAPSANVASLVAEADRQFAGVRGEASGSQTYRYGDDAYRETLYRAPLQADSARDALVTVTAHPDGRVGATYRAHFGRATTELGSDERDERRRREAANQATVEALAGVVRDALPGWTRGGTSTTPTFHECEGFHGRKVTLSRSADGARLVVQSDGRPCLPEPDRALLRAAHDGDAAALARALDAGASVGATGTGRYGSTALHIAAGTGDEATVRLLLGRGTDPDAVSEEGLVPLQHATAETARPLLAAGADPNPATGSPLSRAVISDDRELIGLLLDAGADPDAVVPELGAQSPLHFAAVNGSAAVVRLLLDAGAAPDPADELAFTPLLYAVSGREIENAAVAIEIAGLLLNAGADVNHASSREASYGWTPLMQAARNGEAELVRFLLAADGVDLGARNTEGLTALGAARDEGYDEVAALLAAAGAPE